MYDDREILASELKRREGRTEVKKNSSIPFSLLEAVRKKSESGEEKKMKRQKRQQGRLR